MCFSAVQALTGVAWLRWYPSGLGSRRDRGWMAGLTPVQSSTSSLPFRETPWKPCDVSRMDGSPCWQFHRLPFCIRLHRRLRIFCPDSPDQVIAGTRCFALAWPRNHPLSVQARALTGSTQEFPPSTCSYPLWRTVRLVTCRCTHIGRLEFLLGNPKHPLYRFSNQTPPVWKPSIAPHSLPAEPATGFLP